MLNFADAVLRIDGLFDNELRKKILNYADQAEFDQMQVSGGMNIDHRNVLGTHLNMAKNMSEYVFYKLIEGEILSKYLPNYYAKFRHVDIKSCIQADLLKYNVGGKYEVHVDEGEFTERKLTCVINLNDEYEGGDFVILSPNNQEEIARHKLKTGSVLMFPSYFLYPHVVEPITAGTRYSIVSWLK